MKSRSQGTTLLKRDVADKPCWEKDKFRIEDPTGGRELCSSWGRNFWIFFRGGGYKVFGKELSPIAKYLSVSQAPANRRRINVSITQAWQKFSFQGLYRISTRPTPKRVMGIIPLVTVWANDNILFAMRPTKPAMRQTVQTKNAN
ncbi:hypothetical protein MKZ38_001287 [Zalerion maritima]|uniref:Uncharacterized protein n=1 Tax=Zalerion maritima TaxID=339359 RepID=A0AAD5RQF0_9PEZI|nr:hypothetical protein MKZ38_001287 [Zalerion maritima]